MEEENERVVEQNSIREVTRVVAVEDIMAVVIFAVED